MTMLVACGGGDDSGGTPVVTLPTTPAPTPSPTPSSTLLAAARTFPAMPVDIGGLVAQRGSGFGTFSSGLPWNDLEYTIFDTDYIDGETNGFDTFMPVDPSQPVPGADRLKIINATGNVSIDTAYSGQRGDRIILGTAEIASPFFARGADGIDNDYVVITSFDYSFGHIQLRGSAADYGLVRCTLADGCATDGYYLFHTATGTPDLIAFIYRCDDLPPIAGSNNNTVQTSRALCNSSETLSLNDANQFRYATPQSTTVALTGQRQFGGTGREVVAGITTDSAGNSYTVGLTDSNLDGGTSGSNEIFVARTNADGTPGWVSEMPLTEGSLIWDATADATHLYAVGRTLGALPGQTSAGRWDGFILKIRLSDGVVVATHQWGNAGLDGYGNVVLDDAGNLYVSGQASPVNAMGTDDQHLVAKHRTSDLANVWRQIIAPDSGVTMAVSESWGGLSYIPAALPGQGRLVAGGWFMQLTGGVGQANGFLEVWSDLHLATPRRTASAVINSPGRQADWIMDNAVDAAGNIYAVGYTSGDLQGGARGRGDAFIVRYSPTLTNPVFRQLGTAQADGFRRMEIDSAGNIYAVGFSYGDFARPNADSRRETGDVIVQKFDSALNPLAALQFGTPGEERGYMHLRGGLLHIGGMTEGALGGASRGSFDGFVALVDSGSMLLRSR
jgi:hypothetical protein